MSAADSIRIDVTANNQTDADLAARLVAASFNQNGFEDVTNLTHPTHIDRDEEVVAAMRNLSPGIFMSEVIIDASTFEPTEVVGGTDDDVPGESFPEPDGDDDETDRAYD